MAGGEKGFGGEAGNLEKRLELMEEGKGGREQLKEKVIWREN